jgi:hypothetical protein
VKYHIGEEVCDWTNGCERLLSTELVLTEDERSQLEYYLNEVSRKFLSRTASNLHPMPPPTETSTTQIIA